MTNENDEDVGETENAAIVSAVFECTDLHEHDAYVRAQFDAPGTPGGAMTLRVEKGATVPTLGAFYGITLVPTEAPAGVEKTGPVDTKTTLLKSQEAAKDDASS